MVRRHAMAMSPLGPLVPSLQREQRWPGSVSRWGPDFYVQRERPCLQVQLTSAGQPSHGTASSMVPWHDAFVYLAGPACSQPCPAAASQPGHSHQQPMSRRCDVSSFPGTTGFHPASRSSPPASPAQQEVALDGAQAVGGDEEEGAARVGEACLLACRRVAQRQDLQIGPHEVVARHA